MKAKIIVLDGTDGSGKETQTKLLKENLEKRGFKVKHISFPNYEDDSSIFVKRYLNGDYGSDPNAINPYLASTFYSLDRANLFLTEELDEYDYLLFDRYTTSNIIHQASKIKDKEERYKFINWLEDFEYNKLGLPRPDSIFYLSIDPEITNQLITKRNLKKDIHEKNTDYQKSCYTTAKELSDELNWITIDCAKDDNLRTIEDIQEEILNIIEKKDVK